MNSNVLGVINLIHETDEMEALTASRCLASVPFGSRYRLIDFILSSMVNSGLKKVAVFAHTKYRSLMDHLEAGKNWDLQRRQGGLFILPPATNDSSETRGDLFHFYQHRDFFTRSLQEYVVIARSHMACNIDFSLVLEEHQHSGADITAVCKAPHDLQGGMARKVVADASGRITAMYDHYSGIANNLISMEMYVMRKELLLELVETSLAQGQDHLVRHAIMGRLQQLNVRRYLYEGYLGVVNTVASYYQHSMNLLQPAVGQHLFEEPDTIYTKVKDEPPARYMSGAASSNSLIANGCIIEGTVENSILFRGVHVGKGAVVRNSIIMQNGRIGAGCRLDYAILDKEVTLQPERELCGAVPAPFLAMKRKMI